MAHYQGRGYLSTTAAVAVKPPVFDETEVAKWFNIIESQFIEHLLK